MALGDVYISVASYIIILSDSALLEIALTRLNIRSHCDVGLFPHQTLDP